MIPRDRHKSWLIEINQQKFCICDLKLRWYFSLDRMFSHNALLDVRYCANVLEIFIWFSSHRNHIVDLTAFKTTSVITGDLLIKNAKDFWHRKQRTQQGNALNIYPPLCNDPKSQHISLTQHWKHLFCSAPSRPGAIFTQACSVMSRLREYPCRAETRKEEFHFSSRMMNVNQLTIMSSKTLVSIIIRLCRNNAEHTERLMGFFADNKQNYNRKTSGLWTQPTPKKKMS